MDDLPHLRSLEISKKTSEMCGIKISWVKTMWENYSNELRSLKNETIVNKK